MSTIKRNKQSQVNTWLAFPMHISSTYWSFVSKADWLFSWRGILLLTMIQWTLTVKRVNYETFSGNSTGAWRPFWCAQRVFLLGTHPRPPSQNLLNRTDRVGRLVPNATGSSERAPPLLSDSENAGAPGQEQLARSGRERKQTNNGKDSCLEDSASEEHPWFSSVVFLLSEVDVHPRTKYRPRPQSPLYFPLECYS